MYELCKKELPSPPVLMMRQILDDTVAPNQSIQLYKKLKEEKMPHSIW